MSNEIRYLVQKISKCGEPEVLPSQNVPFGILFLRWLLRKKISKRTFGPTPFFPKGIQVEKPDSGRESQYIYLSTYELAHVKPTGKI